LELQFHTVFRLSIFLPMINVAGLLSYIGYEKCSFVQLTRKESFRKIHEPNTLALYIFVHYICWVEEPDQCFFSPTSQIWLHASLGRYGTAFA